MKKTSLLAGAALLLCAHAATAAENYTCAAPPTCAQLGYNQSVSDCSGKKMLKCPFDTSKVFCGGVNGNCVAEGYSKEDVLLYCLAGSTKKHCPYDSSYTKCVTDCPAAGFTYRCAPNELCISKCSTTQKKFDCPADPHYYKCVSSGNGTIVLKDICSEGFTMTDTDKVKACKNGLYALGIKSTQGHPCYRCGTPAECPNGMKCDIILNNGALVLPQAP